MNPKHYVFNLIDNTPKDKLPKQGPEVLGLYLRAKMYYYIAENKLQDTMAGDEQQYIKMISEEYACQFK